MNNIDAHDKNTHKRYNSWKKLGYVLMLAGLLNTNSPTYAQTNTSNHGTTEQIEPSSINNLNGIKLPAIYQTKLDDFLANNSVMKDRDAKAFTINFVEKEMEADRGISKEIQLLCIRHSIYKQITDNDLYDGQDNDKIIAENFNNKLVNIRTKACGQKYKNGIISYMNKLSAEARQQSAEARQQSAEARQQSAEARQQSAEAIASSLDNLARFYNRYKKDPSTIKDDEVTRRKEDGKKVIQRCKDLGIDYKAKLSPEMLKFYGVE